MKTLIAFVLIFATTISFGQKNSDTAEIRSVLVAQEAAWNRGDIQTFMVGYWNNDSLMFIGAQGPQYGWQQTLNRYKKTYDSHEKMGTLRFGLLQMVPLGTQCYRVLGKWELKRSMGDTGGYFTLIFRKFKEGWRIIYDHTS